MGQLLLARNRMQELTLHHQTGIMGYTALGDPFVS
jgi:hypothetical protein